MIRKAASGSGPRVLGCEDPLRIDPPRKGLRPGTAVGNPQTPF